ncbi:hypothetical protein B0J11DRAFT_295571 [Dendryphion nanum]|uniref:Uncharacterized protein n=1 Tax=Dendryphion nanum TaxID=256645 RepID=A0A9P9DY08_9PLEO|nr:hypothetical protein B0J11DRAFT_295571 [Dendryphion nanum]
MVVRVTYPSLFAPRQRQRQKQRGTELFFRVCVDTVCYMSQTTTTHRSVHEPIVQFVLIPILTNRVSLCLCSLFRAKEGVLNPLIIKPRFNTSIPQRYVQAFRDSYPRPLPRNPRMNGCYALYGPLSNGKAAICSCSCSLEAGYSLCPRGACVRTRMVDSCIDPFLGRGGRCSVCVTMDDEAGGEAEVEEEEGDLRYGGHRGW